MAVITAFLQPRLNSRFVLEHNKGAGGTDVGWRASVRWISYGPFGIRGYPQSLESRSCEAESALDSLATKVVAMQAVGA